MVPQRQDRPRILVERNQVENRPSTRSNLRFDESCSGDFEEASPTFPPPEIWSNSRPSGRTPSLSTHSTRHFACSPFDTERQMLQLQHQISTLTEKIDSLAERDSESSYSPKSKINSRGDEDLPRNMVVRIIFTESLHISQFQQCPIHCESTPGRRFNFSNSDAKNRH